MPRVDIHALAEEVQEKGFCVLTQALNHSVIHEHIAQIAELIATAESDFKHDAAVLKSELRRRKMDLHRESAAANSLLFSDEIVGLIEHLAGAPIVMRQPETGFFQRGTPAHTDSLDFKVMPRSTEYRIWCALEDIDPRSGPVYFVPRSHRTISAVLEDSVAAERPEFLDLLQKQRAPTSAEAFFRETAFLWGQVKKVSLGRFHRSFFFPAGSPIAGKR
jgi:ectoine hydroxylase-related dioxygenase (phytanoyl-CoA dioxygenase family)